MKGTISPKSTLISGLAIASKELLLVIYTIRIGKLDVEDDSYHIRE